MAVKFGTTPLPDLTCHSPDHVCLFLFLPQRQDRLTGGTGLNTNYSIIFTEISFYPETSIVLQIIPIISMKFWVEPEYDR